MYQCAQRKVSLNILNPIIITNIPEVTEIYLIKHDQQFSFRRERENICLQTHYVYKLIDTEDLAYKTEIPLELCSLELYKCTKMQMNDTSGMSGCF